MYVSNPNRRKTEEERDIERVRDRHLVNHQDLEAAARFRWKQQRSRVLS